MFQSCINVSSKQLLALEAGVLSLRTVSMRKQLATQQYWPSQICFGLILYLILSLLLWLELVTLISRNQHPSSRLVGSKASISTYCLSSLDCHLLRIRCSRSDIVYLGNYQSSRPVWLELKWVASCWSQACWKQYSSHLTKVRLSWITLALDWKPRGHSISVSKWLDTYFCVVLSDSRQCWQVSLMSSMASYHLGITMNHSWLVSNPGKTSRHACHIWSIHWNLELSHHKFLRLGYSYRYTWRPARILSCMPLQLWYRQRVTFTNLW